MQSLINLVNNIVTYWTYIVIFVLLVFSVLKKIQSFLNLSEIEKKNAIMTIISEEILKLMSDAEINWSGFVSSGKIKRSEVINEIYKKYPELSKIKDQEEIIKLIDSMINDAKTEMDKIFEKNLDTSIEVITEDK